MYYYPDELYHHGIKGQRWGVRNGPPYPLSPQTHASVVRSGGRGRTRPVSRGRVRGLTDEDTKYDPKFRTKAERDEYERRSARAQKIKKGLMIGAGATAAAAGLGYLAYRNRDKLGSMARNARKSISDRAYIEKEIAKTKLANARKGISEGYNKALGKLPDNVQVAYGKAYYNAGEAANKARGALSTARSRVANRAANVKQTASNWGRAARTSAGVRADLIFKGSKSISAASKAQAAARKANNLYARMDTMRGSGREGALNALNRPATRASAQARRYNDLARGYARRRQIGLGLVGGTAAGIAAYKRRKKRRR